MRGGGEGGGVSARAKPRARGRDARFATTEAGAAGAIEAYEKMFVILKNDLKYRRTRANRIE